MTFEVIETYVDACCPSGENDRVIRKENIEADSRTEAIQEYLATHRVDSNNSVIAKYLP